MEIVKFYLYVKGDYGNITILKPQIIYTLEEGKQYMVRDRESLQFYPIPKHWKSASSRDIGCFMDGMNEVLGKKLSFQRETTKVQVI